MTDEKKNMEEEVDVITLEFDDGVELECEIMGVFEHAGKEYIALIPDDDSDDVYIYGYKEVGDDEFELVDIELSLMLSWQKKNKHRYKNFAM